MTDRIVIRSLGQQDYLPVWEEMKTFTVERTATTSDELWFLEHPPVYTQGQAGKAEHILNPGDIPVIQIDRGGQVTYHGPGQLVVYVLMDVKRSKLGVRDLVCRLETAVINYLNELGCEAHGRRDAPGVYVGEDKICSIGLRVKSRGSYHGIALNVNMDLEPFKRINPCGMQDLKMTQVSDIGGPKSVKEVEERMVHHLRAVLEEQTSIISR